MNTVQSRLLAATGAVALCFVPVAAQAAPPTATAVHVQDGDEAKETGSPEAEEPESEEAEDGGADQEAPADEAQTTADVTEAEADSAARTVSPDAAQDTADESAGETTEDEFGEDGVPADDADFWEEYLSSEGFVGVGCFTEFGSASTYELTEAADPGTDWLLIVLASDDDGGIFDIVSEPQVGEVFSLQSENGSPATLVAAVLCQADLDVSDVDAEDVVDDLDGEGTAVTEETVPVAGPKVETDVPAAGGDSGLGAIVGLSALLMGAGGVVASRLIARR